jgi:transmembrane sensor
MKTINEEIGNTMEYVDVDKAWEKLNNRIEENKKGIAIKLEAEGFPVFYRVAAVLLVVLGISISILLTLTPFNQKIVYSTKALENARYVLPDGSLAELNQSSKIVFKKGLDGELRKIKLTGEAYFEVAHNPSRPFVVETSWGKVTVKGTSFNVLSRNSKKSEVYVTSGVVNVRVVGKDQQQEMDLLAGDLGIISNNNILKKNNIGHNYLAWKTKELVFHETPVSEVVEVLNHAFQSNIEISDPAIGNLKYTATIKNQPLDMVLKAFDSSFDEFTVEGQGRGRLVLMKP